MASVKAGSSTSSHSRSSGSEKLRYWLPSLSSNSNSTSSRQKDVPLPSLLLKSAAARSSSERALDQRCVPNRVLPRSAAPSPRARGAHERQSSRKPLPSHSPCDEDTAGSAPGKEQSVQTPTANQPQSLTPAGVLQKLHKETGISMAELEEAAAKATISFEMIPRNDEGEWASLGSVKHAEDACSPCLFWFKGQCSKGLLCSYCHFRHKGQKNKRIRPSKKTRKQVRDRSEQPPGAEEAGRQSDDDEGDDGTVVPIPLCAENGFIASRFSL